MPASGRKWTSGSDKRAELIRQELLSPFLTCVHSIHQGSVLGSAAASIQLFLGVDGRDIQDLFQWTGSQNLLYDMINPGADQSTMLMLLGLQAW